MLTGTYLTLSEVGLAATRYKLCCRLLADGRGKSDYRTMLIELGNELQKFISDPANYHGKQVFCKFPGLGFLLYQLPPEYIPNSGEVLSGLVNMLCEANKERFNRHSVRLSEMFQEISFDVDQELHRVLTEGGIPRAPPTISDSGLWVPIMR